MVYAYRLGCYTSSCGFNKYRFITSFKGHWFIPNSLISLLDFAKLTNVIMYLSNAHRGDLGGCVTDLIPDVHDQIYHQFGSLGGQIVLLLTVLFMIILIISPLVMPQLGCVVQWLSRMLHTQKAAGSSPAMTCKLLYMHHPQSISWNLSHYRINRINRILHLYLLQSSYNHVFDECKMDFLRQPRIQMIAELTGTCIQKNTRAKISSCLLFNREHITYRLTVNK